MRLGGIVLATILTVGACSSEPTPKEPPTSSTPSSPTPAATAPTLPEQAREDSAEGAAAFVGYYIDVFNYAARTGDVDKLSELSSPDCTGCQRYIKLYRDTYAAGGYFKGGDWEPGKMDVRAESENATVFTRVISIAGTYRMSSGDKAQAGNPEDSLLTFKLSRDGDTWALSVLELQGAS